MDDPIAATPTFSVPRPVQSDPSKIFLGGGPYKFVLGDAVKGIHCLKCTLTDVGYLCDDV